MSKLLAFFMRLLSWGIVIFLCSTIVMVLLALISEVIDNFCKWDYAYLVALILLFFESILAARLFLEL